jgi:transcriptional regulator with XRE-family HTH domain
MRAEKKQGKLKDDFLFNRFRDYVRWTIGLRIGDEISKKRIDRYQLAKMMNRTPTLTYKWTGGKSNLSIDTIAEIAYVAKIPISKIFDFYHLEKAFEERKAEEKSLGWGHLRKMGRYLENPLLEGPPEDYHM